MLELRVLAAPSTRPGQNAADKANIPAGAAHSVSWPFGWLEWADTICQNTQKGSLASGA
jgi:hypothetical protein